MLRRFLAIGKVQIGLAIFAIFTLVAIFGKPFYQLFVDFGPYTIDATSLSEGPSWEHPMGTTSSGQDVLAWLIYGTRASMLVGVVSALVGTSLALITGLCAGFFGGWVDRLVNGLILTFGAIPSFAILIMAAATFPNANLLLVAFIIGAFEWTGGARAVRAQAMSLRDREFINSLKSIGESRWRILFSESLPHLLGVLSPMILRLIAAGIGTHAAVAFLGLGDVSVPSWGLMMSYANSQNALFIGLWWWLVPPGLCIALVGFATTMINFGLDEVTNPSLSTKRMGRVAKYKAYIKKNPKTPETANQEVLV